MALIFQVLGLFLGLEAQVVGLDLWRCLQHWLYNSDIASVTVYRPTKYSRRLICTMRIGQGACSNSAYLRVNGTGARQDWRTASRSPCLRRFTASRPEMTSSTTCSNVVCSAVCPTTGRMLGASPARTSTRGTSIFTRLRSVRARGSRCLQAAAGRGTP